MRLFLILHPRGVCTCAKKIQVDLRNDKLALTVIYVQFLSEVWTYKKDSKGIQNMSGAYMRHFFRSGVSAYWVNKPVNKNKYKSSNNFSEHKHFDMDRHVFAIFQSSKTGLKSKVSRPFME